MVVRSAVYAGDSTASEKLESRYMTMTTELQINIRMMKMEDIIMIGIGVGTIIATEQEEDYEDTRSNV